MWERICLFFGYFFSVLAIASLLIGALVLFAGLFGFGTSLEDFNDLAVATAVYLVIAFAFGGYGLALLRRCNPELMDRIPGLRSVPGSALVFVSTIALIPIALYIALLVSIIASGGLD